MIEIRIAVEATMMVDPTSWDSLGGLEVSVANAIRRGMETIGHDVDLDVQGTAV